MVARPRCAVVDGCGDRVISLRAPCLRTFAFLRAAPSFQVLLARRAPLSTGRDGPSVRAARVQAVAATDGVCVRRRRRRRGQQHRHRAVSARAAASARAARCVGASHVPSPHRRRTTLVHSSGHTATHLHDRGGGGGVRATRGGRPGGSRARSHINQESSPHAAASRRCSEGVGVGREPSAPPARATTTARPRRFPGGRGEEELHRRNDGAMGRPADQLGTFHQLHRRAERPSRASRMGHCTQRAAVHGRALLRWGVVDVGVVVVKAPPVENFAWLPVGVNYNKPARGSVSLI